jgi:hypothetical protein
MVYEEFQAAVTSALKKELGQDYQMAIQKVPKNNGAILDGLCINKKRETIAPTIYLNSYYEQYKEGWSVEELTKEILAIYQSHSRPLSVDFSQLNDFPTLKNNVVYKLIHTHANQELLKSIPSIPYLDLSIVFYLFLEKNETGQMTALIHNRHLTMWNTTLEELSELAFKNTPLLFPADLKTMMQIIQDIICQKGERESTAPVIEELFGSQPPAPLYVLTNTAGINGACTILYPGILKNFSATLNQDLVIIPSSIHEVLLVPYDSTVSLDDLSNMVNQVNHAEVPMEERLSNHVYFYSRQTDQVLILQDSVSPHLS